MLYALRTHETVSTEAPRSRCSCGIEMFTIVTSISAMNRPIITTPQMRQLFAYRYSVEGESGGLIWTQQLCRWA